MANRVFLFTKGVKVSLNLSDFLVWPIFQIKFLSNFSCVFKAKRYRDMNISRFTVYLFSGITVIETCCFFC